MASLADLEQLENIKVETVDDQLVTKEEAKERAIASLEDDPRWKSLVDYWLNEIAAIDEKINDIDSDITDKELDRLRIRRFYLQENIELPKRNRDLFLNRERENSSSQGGNTSDENI